MERGKATRTSTALTAGPVPDQLAIGVVLQERVDLPLRRGERHCFPAEAGPSRRTCAPAPRQVR